MAKARGKYGFGSLQEIERKDGSTVYRWLYWQGGKRRTSPRLAKEEVKPWAAKHLFAERPASGPSTFRSAAERWLDGRGGSDDTVQGYKQALAGHLLPYFGARQLGAITSDHLNKYANAKLDGSVEVEPPFRATLSRPTLRKHLWMIRSIYDHAIYTGRFAAANPARAKGLKINPAAKTSKPQPKALGSLDQRALCDACPEEWKPFLGVLLMCGLRFGEATALIWNDWQKRGDESYLHIKRAVKHNGKIGEPKSEHGVRTLALSGEVVQLLKQHHRRQRDLGKVKPHDLIFSNAAGKPLSNTSFARRHLQKWVEAAGIRRITPHVLRHTFAYNQANDGCHAALLKELMGHHSSSFTLDVYAKWLEPEIPPVASVFASAPVQAR